MKGFRIGSAFGIGLYLHWSLALLFAWVGYEGYRGSEQGAPGGWEGAVFSGLALAALFTCVILHELGHSLAARRVGVPTHSITLYPIGGVARLAFMPRTPKHELWIAIAGPAVNVAIVILLIPVLFLVGLPPLEEGALPAYDLSTFVTALLLLNLIMIVFNLVPAFPMDGGRVLRALMAWKGNYRTATEIAARLGQLIALVFMAVGLGWVGGLGFTPTLLLIGFFIFIAAEAERKQANRISLFERYPIPPPPPPAPVKTVIISPDQWEIHPK